MINYRLTKLLDIHKLNRDNQSYELIVSKIKPPIFWKEKPIFIKMLKKWDKHSVIRALVYLGSVEKKIKNDSALNSLTIIKNSITNICTNSFAYF